MLIFKRKALKIKLLCAVVLPEKVEIQTFYNLNFWRGFGCWHTDGRHI